MNTKSKNWTEPIIGLLLMMNALLLVHLLNYGIVAEQSAQVLAVLLFYGWLAQWIKRA